MKQFIGTMQKKYYQNTLRSNMLIFFMTLFILITVPSILLIRHINEKNTQDQINYLSLNSLELEKSNLTQILDGTGKISLSLLSNNILQNFLKTPAYAHDPAQTILLENALYNACATSTNRLSAYLYTYDNNCYFFDHTRKQQLLKPAIFQTDIYKELIQADGKTVFFSSSELYQGTTGISVGRVIKNLDTLLPEGILILNIPQETLLHSLFDHSGQRGFIKSEKGSVILDMLPSTFNYETLSSTEKNLSYIRPIDNGHSHQMLYYGKLNNYPFMLGILQETGTHTSSYFGTSFITLILLFFNGSLMLLGICILSVSFTQPITALAEKLTHIHNRSFQKITTKFQTSNEIGCLVSSYNEMTDQIQTLMKKELAAEKYRRHLELSLLQAQFKPHFLYNTLDSARLLCRCGETEHADQLLKAIGSYYRTVLSKGRTVIPIEQEVDSIRQFETILSFKEEKEFEIIYNIKDSVRSLPILKFILQPLVENCIKHGFYGLDDGVIIITAAIQEDNTLLLSVADNGKGMDPDLITQLQNNQIESISRSFGLAATLKRLKLYYGEDFHYQISGQLNEGTCITFTITHFKTYISKENPYEANSKIIDR